MSWNQLMVFSCRKRNTNTAAALLVVVFFCTAAVSRCAPVCPEINADTGELRWTCGAELEHISDLLPFLKQSPEIVTLDISQNRVKRIQAHDFGDHTRRLQHLNLSYNEISRIEEDAFVKLSRLISLDLSHNKLRAIDTTELAGLRNLRELNLSSNPLTQIAAAAFESVPFVSFLDISFTPLFCDCHLAWLIKRNRRDIKPLLSGREKCFTPISVANARLQDLKESDFLCGTEITLPDFYISPAVDQMVFYGDSVVLTCGATRFLDDSTKLIWYQNGILQSFSAVTYQNNDGIMTASLRITNITQHHNGNWTCQAMAGEKVFKQDLTTRLIVMGRDDFTCPRNVTITNRGTFEWPQTFAKDVMVDVPCPDNSLLKATHRCDASGKWTALDVSACPFTTIFGTVMQKYATGAFKKEFSPEYRVGLMKTYLLSESAEHVLRADEADLVVKALELFTKSAISSASPADSQKALLDILQITDWFLQMPYLDWVESLKYEIGKRILNIIRTVGTAMDVVELRNFAVVTVTVNENRAEMRCETSVDDIVVRVACDGSNQWDNRSRQGVVATVQVSLQNPQPVSPRKLQIISFRNVKPFAAVLKSSGIAPSSVAVGVFVADSQMMTKKASVFSVDLMVPSILGSESGSFFTPEMEYDGSKCGMPVDRTEESRISLTCSQYGIALISQPFHHIVGIHTGMLSLEMPYPVYASTIFVVLCLMVLLVLYAFSATSINLNRNYFHVLLNLWFSSCALLLTFLVGFTETKHGIFCSVIGVLLQLETVCVVNWALAGMFVIYTRTGKAPRGNFQNAVSKAHKSTATCGTLGYLYLFGWSIPAVITILSVGLLNLLPYASPQFCYISHSYSPFAVGLPSGCMVFACIAYFLVIHRHLSRPNSNAGTNCIKETRLHMHTVLMTYLVLFVVTYVCAGFWVSKSTTDINFGTRRGAWEQIGFSASLVIWGIVSLLVFWFLRDDVPKFCWSRKAPKYPHDNRTVITVPEGVIANENGPMYENCHLVNCQRIRQFEYPADPTPEHVLFPNQRNRSASETEQHMVCYPYPTAGRIGERNTGPDSFREARWTGSTGYGSEGKKETCI